MLSPARYFCPKQLLYIFGNLRVFGNFSDMSTFFFFFCTVYRPEQNDLIKPFFLDFYSSGQDTMLKFFTLTNTPKGYCSKKNFQDGSHYVYFTYQNMILFLVCKICNFDTFQFFLK